MASARIRQFGQYYMGMWRLNNRLKDLSKATIAKHEIFKFPIKMYLSYTSTTRQYKNLLSNFVSLFGASVCCFWRFLEFAI